MTCSHVGNPLQPRVRTPGARVRDTEDHVARRRDQTGSARVSGARQPRRSARLGYAKDYVEAMWLMLQHDKPDDFVIATGETNTVERCVEVAFDEVGLDWKQYVRQDPQFMRPAEVDLLVGDPAKAKRELGWEPTTNFDQLIRLMVQADVELLSA